MSKIIKLRTLYQLGVLNILRVALYRVSLKFKFSAIRQIKGEYLSGSFFREEASGGELAGIAAFDGWNKRRTYYSLHKIEDESVPEWHRHPFTGNLARNSNKIWWEISDFDPEVGDIKSIWESSRFDWVLGFAQYGISDKTAITKLNQWLSDWCDSNQPYLGTNWKCGQEASIRLIHLSLAAQILGQLDKPEPALIRLIEIHLTRIKPTISYAIAQNNNHGTSEAAALYIGGSWLLHLGISSGKMYQTLGVKWLENRADKLILADGTFSQYSVNYHRLMLDTFSVVEVWRSKMGLESFSDRLYQKLQLATDWLYQFTQAENGDVPNLGSNDGAMLLSLGNASYRDFRPSVQLASTLFFDQSAYIGEGVWNNYVHWLQLPKATQSLSQPISKSMAFGGYELLRNAESLVVFNIPKFVFRPCQSDVFHVDLWHKGQNILRDGGTYSYNCAPDVESYFSGVRSHNTIQFDNRDQMPKLSRFLFGEWAKVHEIEPLKTSDDVVKSSASYKDYKGACHHRSVELEPTCLTVVDSVADFESSAILRWRLLPGSWVLNLDNFSLRNEEYVIYIECSSNIERFELVQGEESRFYQHKNQLPVLEVEVKDTCKLISKIEFM